MSRARMDMWIAEGALRTLATGALEGFSVLPRDAAATANILERCDLFGLHTQGTRRIESYGQHLRLGGIHARPSIRVEPVAPSIARPDGDNRLGTLATVSVF